MDKSQPVTVEQLIALMAGLMNVDSYTILSASPSPRPVVQLRGHLVDGDQDEIFDAMMQRLAPWGYTPTLSEEDGEHVLQLFPLSLEAKPTSPWPNLVLFVLTLLSVLLIGALHENADLSRGIGELWRGWPFALTLLGILTAHELSHYFVGRWYGSPLSLPYFIPFPLSVLGTMGAVIVQRGPMRSRKALFDIGVAGPLGGLIVAVPLLFIGLALSEVGYPTDFIPPRLLREVGLQQEGNSLLYLAAKYIVHGRILPSPDGMDVWLSPPSRGGSIAFAAWAGLLVTSLNLFPIGQFDGGHIAYALWGRRAWKIARGFLFLMFAWGFFLVVMGNSAGTTWIIWAGVGAFMGPRHPPPLNDLTPLKGWRRLLGWFMVLVFFLILVPVPLVEVHRW